MPETLHEVYRPSWFYWKGLGATLLPGGSDDPSQSSAKAANWAKDQFPNSLAYEEEDGDIRVAVIHLERFILKRLKEMFRSWFRGEDIEPRDTDAIRAHEHAHGPWGSQFDVIYEGEEERAPDGGLGHAPLDTGDVMSPSLSTNADPRGIVDAYRSEVASGSVAKHVELLRSKDAADYDV